MGNDLYQVEDELENILSKNVDFIKSIVATHEKNYVSFEVNLINDISELTESSQDLIKRKIANYCELYEIKLYEITFSSIESKQLTNSIILNKIKVMSPVSLNELVKSLRDLGYEIHDKKYIQKKLDSLRKKYLIIRLKNGNYSPTEDALNVIPHGKYRESSDIYRMLELKRKTW